MQTTMKIDAAVSVSPSTQKVSASKPHATSRKNSKGKASGQGDFDDTLNKIKDDESADTPEEKKLKAVDEPADDETAVNPQATAAAPAEVSETTEDSSQDSAAELLAAVDSAKPQTEDDARTSVSISLDSMLPQDDTAKVQAGKNKGLLMMLSGNGTVATAGKASNPLSATANTPDIALENVKEMNAEAGIMPFTENGESNPAKASVNTDVRIPSGIVSVSTIPANDIPDTMPTQNLKYTQINTPEGVVQNAPSSAQTAVLQTEILQDEVLGQTASNDTKAQGTTVLSVETRVSMPQASTAQKAAVTDAGGVVAELVPTQGSVQDTSDLPQLHQLQPQEVQQPSAQPVSIVQASLQGDGHNLNGENPQQQGFDMTDGMQDADTGSGSTDLRPQNGAIQQSSFQQSMQEVSAAEQPQATSRTARTYDIPQQIVEQARLIRADRDAEMVIRLKPEHLGHLTLRISVTENGSVNASFHSDNAQVRAIIESSMIQLRQDLQAQGIQVDKIDVYSGLGDGSLPDSNPGQQGMGQSGRHYTGRDQEMGYSVLEDSVDPMPADDTADNEDGVDYRV